jgi:uncharacterized protein YdhG (YjbR/CyaY superfamily)
MKSRQTHFTTVDEYVAAFPSDIKSVLNEIRATIRKAAPEATEKISYNMPAFWQGRDIVYFGAFKTHIGLYPPVRDPDLIEETLPYRGEKGNLKFPLDQPIPYALISRIVSARVTERLERGPAAR